MIRVICKNCGSKLNAKDELVGQTRNCPKCSNPVVIELPARDENPGLLRGNNPVRLDISSRYCICSADRLIAFWESSKGWQINVGTGFTSPRKSPEAIPDQGAFVLAEFRIVPCEEGQKISEMNLFHLGTRGCLMALAREESDILARIDGPGQLTQRQKAMLLEYLRKNFMFPFLEASHSVVELLQ